MNCRKASRAIHIDEGSAGIVLCVLVRSGNDPEWRSPKTTAYEDEATLQDLIAGSPSLLPGVEEPVAAVTELGISGGGSADVVMVDAAGAITIVECKLKKNPEIRMRVIGQVFWYAAALWQLEYEELERAFAERGVPSLAAPFAGESEWEETAFRDAVSENLSSGAFRLVIAVDEITDELKRAVLYINHHTVDEIGLLALELNYTEHEGVEMLIPDVYGEESAEPGTPTPPRFKTIDELKAQLPDETIRSWVDYVPKRLEELFPDAEVRLDIPGTGDGSLSMNGKVRLGWWYSSSWLFAWSDERFKGDEELLRARLSKPGEVKTAEDFSDWAVTRFHVASEDDLKVFEDFARGICKQATA